MKLELETYTPREAEVITGVTQATVRNWRRAGYLPKHEGHARYNLADLLVMFSMQELVVRGTTLEAAKPYAGEAARAIYHSAVYIREAYLPGVEDIAMRDVIENRGDDLKAFAKGIEEKHRDNAISFLALDTMACAGARLAGINGLDPVEWLVIWANGEIEFFTSTRAERDFFSAYGRDEYVAGPVMLFCLPALARVVIDRLPRPAFRLAKESL